MHYFNLEHTVSKPTRFSGDKISLFESKCCMRFLRLSSFIPLVEQYYKPYPGLRDNDIFLLYLILDVENTERKNDVILGEDDTSNVILKATTSFFSVAFLQKVCCHLRFRDVL